jgi:DNA-binding GntR family transcriptional regulator
VAKARLRPAARTRLTDHAYAAMRESIIAGRFRMGEHLVETELSAELQMSRAPIREALQRLASEGLVVERAHQGSFVAEFTADDVRDIYNVRVGLEITALRLFLARGAPTAPLRHEISEMERAAAKGKLAQVATAEFRFHRHIASESQNAFVERWFTDLEGPLMLVMAMDDALFEKIDEVAAEHVPVLEAIESGDEARAVRVFHEHIMSTVGHLLDRLGGDRTTLLQPIVSGRPRRR